LQKRIHIQLESLLYSLCNLWLLNKILKRLQKKFFRYF